MAINTARLEQLAKMLEDYAVAPSPTSFDLRAWSTTQIRRGGFLWLRQIECGTAACAVGLACLSGAFKQEGLGYFRDHDRRMHPTYAGKSQWRAVESFFGLTDEQAERLFLDTEYEISRGPEAAIAVAHRIRTMVRRSNVAKARRKIIRRTTEAVERIKADALV